VVSEILPLYSLLSHPSSFISLLHPNYQARDPLVILSPPLLPSPPTHSPPSLSLSHHVTPTEPPLLSKACGDLPLSLQISMPVASLPSSLSSSPQISSSSVAAGLHPLRQASSPLSSPTAIARRQATPSHGGARRHPRLWPPRLLTPAPDLASAWISGWSLVRPRAPHRARGGDVCALAISGDHSSSAQLCSTAAARGLGSGSPGRHVLLLLHCLAFSISTTFRGAALSIRRSTEEAMALAPPTSLPAPVNQSPWTANRGGDPAPASALTTPPKRSCQWSSRRPWHLWMSPSPNSAVGGCAGSGGQGGTRRHPLPLAPARTAKKGGSTCAK
jgi:hypothetical protein